MMEESSPWNFSVWVVTLALCQYTKWLLWLCVGIRKHGHSDKTAAGR